MKEPNELIKEQLKKLEAIKSLGIDAYGGRFSKQGLIASITQSFEDKKSVQTAGRLYAMRVMGKSTFCDLKDESGRIQLYVKHENLSAEEMKLFEYLDIGDI